MGGRVSAHGAGGGLSFICKLVLFLVVADVRPKFDDSPNYLGRKALEASAAAVQSSRAAPSVIRDLWRREHPGELHQMTPSVGQEATVGAYASQVRVPVRSVARDHGAGAEESGVSDTASVEHCMLQCCDTIGCSRVHRGTCFHKQGDASGDIPLSASAGH